MDRNSQLDARSTPTTRNYQQEMFEESLQKNIIIAMDTGSGKTHIAVLRMKRELERQPDKISWFLAPTVTLCAQQRNVIQTAIPVSVGLISGASEPEQWKNSELWIKVLSIHRIVVTTPQVLLDALRHGYVVLGRDISLLIFDEAHHAADNHPYNRIMLEFYHPIPREGYRLDESRFVSRPRILGLTASPIFGGNAVEAFRIIEKNLDSIIRSPRRHRTELAEYVHRPVFKHVMYDPLNEFDPPFSTNLASLNAVLQGLKIEDDPYVQSLRMQLSKTMYGSSDYFRIDQKLSKTILKQDSYTHKGLRDFARAANDILNDLGAWAADWYVYAVLQQAKRAENPYNNIIVNWKNEEKAYLVSMLNRIEAIPPSYYPDDIVDDASSKVHALISCLLQEKEEAEAADEVYSSLIFVQRRDTVIALAELLTHYPVTKDLFRIGSMVGMSDNAQRRSFLDITRTLTKDSQDDTLADFKIGEKNVIVSTAVAEEGIDIQACGSVIRWDPPPNMASWAQSRGRARRRRSTFTLMFERGSAQQHAVSKWEELERMMVALYTDPTRELMQTVDESLLNEEENLEFRIPSTGACLTLHSAISHLAHFCAVIPNTSHVDNRPMYDTDPPVMPEAWHTFDVKQSVVSYPGPFGSKVTLPKCLPLPNREFVTERIYRTRISAHRHAAFKAYMALYEAELLNEYLLPISSVIEPHLEEEIQQMLKDVEKRAGMANVSLQMDPWVPEPADQERETWWSYELTIGKFPPLFVFTRSESVNLPDAVLYRRGSEPMVTILRPTGPLLSSDTRLQEARLYTRRLFWCFYGHRMTWEDVNFSYLFLPVDQSQDAEWAARRSWLSKLNQLHDRPPEHEIYANAEAFGREFSYPTDIVAVRRGFDFGRGYRFLRWRYEQLSPEEEEEFLRHYSRITDLEITYPIIVAEQFPTRTNFLFPLSPQPPSSESQASARIHHFIPRLSSVTLLSAMDVDYAFILPSVLRHVQMFLTAHSLRETLFRGSLLYSIPLELINLATIASSSQERVNYQRLETLGDTVLKFVVGIQLLAEYPLWHEGYLTRRKDHAVSNGRLAKEDVRKGLYRWIIRDRLLGKKWKPSYFTKPSLVIGSNDLPSDDQKMKQSADTKRQELSTKLLADVVESLIGAAYLHGSFGLGYECAKFFDLGLKWEPLQQRIEAVLSRVSNDTDIPPQLGYVEQMLGYTFRRKMLLLEALTHASYELNQYTPSYERLEFLGDCVLDMIVTDYLYHAANNYSPGKIHMRRSAVVNAHILAYICLSCSVSVDASMPGRTEAGIALLPDTQEVHLWQCLLHSSPRVLDDQNNTFARFKRRRGDIEAALSDRLFPWADLTRLQAPKFFSDIIEAILGAVYLDSGGDFEAPRSVARRLGILPLLERIVTEDIDVLHPVSRMSLWAQQHDREIGYEIEKAGGKVTCVVTVDGIEETRHTEEYRGQASQEEVKFLAAEQAIRTLKLRTIPSDKKKKKPKPKKSKRTNALNLQNSEQMMT